MLNNKEIKEDGEIEDEDILSEDEQQYLKSMLQQ